MTKEEQEALLELTITIGFKERKLDIFESDSERYVRNVKMFDEIYHLILGLEITESELT